MINALSTAIYNKLRADGTLMTALGGTAANGWKIYNIIARKSVEVPYIVFSLLTDLPEGVFGTSIALENATFYVNSHAKSSKTAGANAVLAMAVLDDATLTITGFTNIDLRREMIQAPLFDIDTGNYTVPMRYRAILDKN